jgi:glycosyltransferase involved in cell wall biosynthesis
MIMDTTEHLHITNYTNNYTNGCKTLVCIPAFNEQQSIAQVVTIAKKFADHVIVIDDGSTDKTAEEAQKAGGKVFRHPINLGYGAAISSCLRSGVEAGADVIITLDADLQHNPQDIPLLVKPILDGSADIVTGSRFIEKNRENMTPRYRKLGITLLTKVTNIMGQTTITDSQSGFRAYSNYAAKILVSMPFSAGMGASSQILIEAFRRELRIKEISVNISYNTGFDTSSENALSHGLRVLMSIIQYVIIRRPLLLIGIPGIAILSIGVMSLLSLIDIYNNTKVIAVGLGLLTIATNTIGLFIILTSIILYTLSNISKEASLQSKQMNNFNRSMDVGTNHKDSDN